jgi:hypothetical protein
MRTTYYNTKKLCILPKKSICVPCMILMWSISYQSSLFLKRGGMLSSKEKTAFHFSVSQFRIYSETLIYMTWHKSIAQDSKLKIMNLIFVWPCIIDINNKEAE